jgi:hypothetical protein
MTWIRGYRYLMVAAITIVSIGVRCVCGRAGHQWHRGRHREGCPGRHYSGATISLISETRGTTFDAQSGATGDFVLSNVPVDTYTIRVSMDGFKTSERKGVRVSAGDRVAVGAVTVEVGTLAETVTVSGDSPTNPGADR